MTSLSQRPDQWKRLAQFTQARVGLDRVGVSQGTADVLDFLEAHAHARDAVHAALNVNALSDAFQRAGFQTLHVHSRAEVRQDFLRRPDLGRRLDERSTQLLTDMCSEATAQSLPLQPSGRETGADNAKRLALVVADGLSSFASMCHALPVAVAVRALLPEWEISRVILAEQARVALGDEVGAICSATATLMLLGERPGLQAADSLGAYITYQPQIGRSDAERNCVSNIHPRGLQVETAARKIAWFLREALLIGATGIALKGEANSPDRRSPRVQLKKE